MRNWFRRLAFRFWAWRFARKHGRSPFANAFFGVDTTATELRGVRAPLTGEQQKKMLRLAEETALGRWPRRRGSR